jgi:hypothetical protein
VDIEFYDPSSTNISHLWSKEEDMKKIIVFASLFLAVISNAWAEGVPIAPPGNWNKVQTLVPSTNIVVKLKHAGEIDGEFMRLNEDSIVVKEFGSEKIFPKNEVDQVQWKRPGSRVRHAAIMGPIFFGLGFGLGYAAAPKIGDDDNMSGSERAKAGVAIGGIIGGIAAGVSLARNPGSRSEVIYRSK